MGSSRLEAHGGNLYKLIHISDLHLSDKQGDKQKVLLNNLFAALRQEGDDRGPADRVAVTGDLFDSAGVEADVAREQARDFFAKLSDAVGGVPIVVLPGNHDRRKSGLVGPHCASFFCELETNLAGMKNVTVLPFSENGSLVSKLPGTEGVRPCLDVAVLDTTRLLTGAFSSGGLIRPEDLLSLAAELGPAEGESRCPLILLMHHHLVPTPVTDRSRIDTSGLSWPWGCLAGWLLGLLARLVTNVDHEELMMTAFGAGTALSLLHAFRRPVMILHGHKHVATARLLVGPSDEDGDLVLASAGSAGLRENWNSTEREEAGVPIWPSFNVVTLDDAPSAQVSASVVRVRFDPNEKPNETPSPETLMAVTSAQARWIRQRTSTTLTPAKASTFALLENKAEFVIGPSGEEDRFDIACKRRIVRGQSKQDSCEETLELPGDSELVTPTEKRTAHRHQEVSIRIPILDAPTASQAKPWEYKVHRGLCRTGLEADRGYDVNGETYEWVKLLNRYDCEAVTVTLSCEGDARIKNVFASEMDIGTGAERPVWIQRSGTGPWVIERKGCAARTLFRIGWQLDNARGRE